jgi:hypothetical protein
MSAALEVAREQEVSWRGALEVSALRTFWFVVPQVFVAVLFGWIDRVYFGGYPFRVAAREAALALVVWAMVCAGEVVVRWLAMHRAERIQLAGPELRPRVDLVKVGWSVWFAATAMMGMLAPRAVAMSALCVLACLCLTALLRWPLMRLRAARQHRALLATLAAQLERDGVHVLGASAPARVEVERRFWRERQAIAVSALQRRSSLLPAIAAPSTQPSLDSGWFLLRWYGGALCLVCGAFVLCSGGRSWLVDTLAWCILVLILMCSLMPFAAAGVWGVERLLLVQRQRAQRRIFRDETRWIATLAELAGGLSLAEHVTDAALVGALSGEVTRSGALSGVEL